MDKQNVKIRINFAIMVILMIGIGFLPPFGQVTPMGMRVLGVFVGTLYGWITIDFVMASMVGMLFLGLSGYTNIIGALAAGFAGPGYMAVFFRSNGTASHLEKVLGLRHRSVCGSFSGGPAGHKAS